MFTQSSQGKYLVDIYYSSRAIYASIGMSVVYCIIYIYLMSEFAECLAWVCIVLT